VQAGGDAQAMEQRRDQRGLPWLEDSLQDARFGARMLRRAPLITAVALLTLTLAIGANSAIFSLVDPLLFRDVPVRDPASLVQFTFQYPRDPPLNIFSLANYEQYRDGNHVFSDLFDSRHDDGVAHEWGSDAAGWSPATSSRRLACGRRWPRARRLRRQAARPRPPL
jgi:hypothetical protein